MQKQDKFCFTYQLVDCLYTLFKYRFDRKVVNKNGQVFDNIEQAVRFNQRHQTVEKMPSLAEKRLLRKKYKRHLLSSLQKPNSTHICVRSSTWCVRTRSGHKVGRTHFSLGGTYTKT